jgi:hypothetical protein
MAYCPDIRPYVLTDYARWEMQRRGVTEVEALRRCLLQSSERKLALDAACTSRASIWGNRRRRVYCTFSWILVGIRLRW